MTEQVKKEIIKAYAYGKHLRKPRRLWASHWKTPKGSRRKNAEEIEERKSQLESGGWLK